MITHLGFLTAIVRRKRLVIVPRRDLRQLRHPWLRRLIRGQS